MKIHTAHPPPITGTRGVLRLRQLPGLAALQDFSGRGGGVRGELCPRHNLPQKRGDRREKRGERREKRGEGREERGERREERGERREKREGEAEVENKRSNFLTYFIIAVRFSYVAIRVQIIRGPFIDSMNT